MTPSTWKDGELAYCRRLVATGGNLSVPERAVASYLTLQMHDAKQHHYEPERRALAALIDTWAVRQQRVGAMEAAS